MENLNLLFYKTFYSKLGENTFEDDILAKSKKLVSEKFYENDYKKIDEEIAPDKFCLKTSYPGLLVGTGYAHGVESDKDIKIGFSFDYVTGQPYIPGSSVKGLLKSYFKHQDVINEYLKMNLSSEEIKDLKYQIFESENNSSVNTDVFFDAVIRCGDKNGNTVGFDSITPHGTDLTKNPTPLKILKVLPDVILEFSFNLKNTKIGEKTISKDQKKALFAEILCHFGIGSKTNVGYGVLSTVDNNETFCYPTSDTHGATESLVPEKNKEYTCLITGRKEYTDSKTNQKKINIYIKLESSDISGFINMESTMARGLKIGERITAKYKHTNAKGHNYFVFVGI